jgi:hypothetical protein
MRRFLVLLSCNCGHLSSVSMFVTELVLWNLLQVYLAISSLLLSLWIRPCTKRNLKVNSKPVKEKAYTSLIRPKLESKLKQFVVHMNSNGCLYVTEKSCVFLSFSRRRSSINMLLRSMTETYNDNFIKQVVF